MQLSNTCFGCKRNCTVSANKSALLVSAMENCKRPLHSVVSVISEHSENLYKTVSDLKVMLHDQPASGDGEIIHTSSSDTDNLCWCSVDHEID